MEGKDEFEKYVSQRPSLDQVVQRDSSGLVVQMYPFSPVVLYGMALHVDALRIVVEALRREMFRNDLKITEVYAYKCMRCGKEFKSKPQNELGQDECDECGGHNLARPDPKNRQFLKTLLRNPVNNNRQTLKDVAFQLEWDLDIRDDFFCLLLKNYEIDSMGEITKRTIKEIIRGDPLQIFYVADNQGRIGYTDDVQMATEAGKSSTPVLVCPRPEHRDKKLNGEKCDRCGAVGQQAIVGLKSLYSINRQPTISDYFYIDGEVIHGSKYQPGLLYGYSPLYAIWIKVMSLYYQDKYILKYYDYQRAPRAIFAVATRSLSSFNKAWDALKKWAREDPEQVHPLAIETDRGGKSLVQFVDLMRSLEEMQFIEARNEFRRTIGAIYGVLPLFSGDLTASGWNNEAPQVMVTNRSVKFSQSILVNTFFDKLVQRMGIHDWRIEFESSEEMDKLRQYQIEGQLLANAEAYKRMGFKIWFTHTGELMHDKLPQDMLMGSGVSADPMMQDLSGKRPNAPHEELGTFQGEPLLNRPSDTGGVAEGFPASGDNTSMSNKQVLKVDSAGFGTLDELMKSLDEDGDFTSEIVSKAIADMKLDASNQAWRFDYVGVGKPMEKDIRTVVQLMFTHNVGRNTAKENLIRIGLDKKQSELIVKTEYQHMLNRAKELAYLQSDPDGSKFKYKWDTSKDTHVCDLCQRVNALTKNGVTLRELKDVVHSVATSFGSSAIRMWHLHPLDRCEVKRVKQ